MRRPHLRLLLGIGVPLLVVVVLLGAWAIDSSSANAKVPRNVTLAGRNVSKLPEDELAAAVAEVADGYAKMQVSVRTDDRTYELPAAQLGLRLDEQATVKASLKLDDSTVMAKRPLMWLGSFLAKRTAPLRFSVDPAVLEQGLAKLAGNAAASEPSVVATGDGFGILSGSNGLRIEPAGVREQLLARARSGEKPIVIDAQVSDRAPLVTDDVARAVAYKLSGDTANGLVVNTGISQTVLPTPLVRSWVGAKVEGDHVTNTIDGAKALSDLTAALPPPTFPQDASIALVNGAILTTPSTDGLRCCAPDTVPRLLAGITSGSGRADIALDVIKPGFSTDDANKLGIVAPVGNTTEWMGRPQVNSFTTYYEANQPRVTNIHRIADIVRGTIVRPGQTFSLNTIVGERTLEKGFVVAGAIADGEHVDEVGGGVSQFTTTMFNAVFFAGLPIGESQAHSEHFDRYPYGREATLGFEHPDLRWTNYSPYGILVGTSYDDTSVTVTLYSTQFTWAEQTNQTETHTGNCTKVTTERTIHYPDGHSGTDTVGANYRDKGATSC